MLLLQLGWTKSCPNLCWKAGKCQKKCSSNALKLPHFSALRLKFPLPAPLEQPSRGCIPSSCLSCCFHGNWGPTAQIRCFNHYFLPFSSHFPACQRGTIPLYLTFLRQVLSSLESHTSLCFGRIKLGILQCLLSLPTMANFNGKLLPWLSKKAICSLECYSIIQSFDCYSITFKSTRSRAFKRQSRNNPMEYF